MADVRSPLTGRDAFEVLALGRRVAVELAAEAADLARPRSIEARRALAEMAVLVDEAVAARVGAAPLDGAARAQLARTLDEIGATEQTHQRPP